MRCIDDGASIGTGCCEAIDAALLGGVAFWARAGGVCCVSGAKGVGKSLVRFFFGGFFCPGFDSFTQKIFSWGILFNIILEICSRTGEIYETVLCASTMLRLYLQ